jgi:putative Mn2+ efflux pump MntP
MGQRRFNRTDALRFAISSGGAEAIATLIGFFAGSQVISKIEAWDHWIAFILLLLVASHMGYEGIEHLRKKGAPPQKSQNFHHFSKILLVSIATSMDAFGVGISLGIAHKPILAYVLSIGLWAFSATIAGLLLARKLSSRFGPAMHLVGAVVLGALAFQMLQI